jgi:hypothetical protein
MHNRHMVAYLINNGANTNIHDIKGLTVLQQAVGEDSSKLSNV